MPGDLAQAMVAQSREARAEAKADAEPVDLAQATVALNVATNEIAANTKTVQAFDAMLEELARTKKTRDTPQTD